MYLEPSKGITGNQAGQIEFGEGHVVVGFKYLKILMKKIRKFIVKR